MEQTLAVWVRYSVRWQAQTISTTAEAGVGWSNDLRIPLISVDETNLSKRDLSRLENRLRSRDASNGLNRMKGNLHVWFGGVMVGRKMRARACVWGFWLETKRRNSYRERHCAAFGSCHFGVRVLARLISGERAGVGSFQPGRPADSFGELF